MTKKKSPVFFLEK